MGTISKKIADDIIAGKYPEDKCVKIVTYNNMFDGGLTYAAVFVHENPLKYEQAEACSDVKTYWEAKPSTIPESRPPFKTLNAAWESLRDEVLAGKFPIFQEYARKLFFTGALVLFDMTVTSAPKDDDEAMENLAAISDELTAFRAEGLE